MECFANPNPNPKRVARIQDTPKAPFTQRKPYLLDIDSVIFYRHVHYIEVL